MPDSSIPDVKDKLVHLERLFLIAQFLTSDVNEAAGLVEATYMEASKSATSANVESFSSLVELIMIQASSSSFKGPEAKARQFLSDTVRKRAAQDFLEDRVRLVFLSMQDSERMELWASVESGETASADEPVAAASADEPVAAASADEPDALGTFCSTVSDLASPLESEVFGDHLSRSNVATALQTFWATAFVPAPPTLRSVLESRLRGKPRYKDPAFDRKASRVMKKNLSGRPARLLLYVLIIVLAAGSGYVINRSGEPEAPSTNILELSELSLESVDVSFPSNSPEQVERFILDRFGWRLTTPVISGATLVGLSMNVVADDIEVPVFVFTDDEGGDTIPVMAYTYGFFERNRILFTLPPGTLRQIQRPAGFDIHELEDRTAVVWRDRDDIFAAFLAEGGQNFGARVSRDS